MRILQFDAEGAPGGASNHVFQLLTGLAGSHESAVLTQRGSHLAARAVDAGIDVHEAGFSRGQVASLSALSLKKTIREFRPDLIHCHGGRAAFLTSLSKRPTPVVYTVHDLSFARKPIAAKCLSWCGERWTMGRSRNILFVCDFDRRLAKTSRLLNADTPFDVIYNGVCPPHPSAAGDRKLGIGFIGRMVPQKHPEQFVELISRLPDARGVMVGGGPLEANVRELIQKHGLENRLDLLGRLSHRETMDVLARLEVLVMTPRWDGLPLLPLEAMSLGVPVVSTAVGGIPEIINHGETGLLAKNSTVEELSELTRNIASNAKLRERIVDRAKRVVEERFDQKTMIRRVEACYIKCLRKSPANRDVRTQATPDRAPQSVG